MIASPYIVHAPEPGPDGRCALCRRETALRDGRLEHSRNGHVAGARTRYACAAPSGQAGEDCATCGRPLREYLPGRVEHARGRVAGVSPHAYPGTPAWFRQRDNALRRKARALANTRPGYCECGTPLSKHPPLPKPKPLTSWKAQRAIEDSLYLR